jgi:hypothetical protein
MSRVTGSGSRRSAGTGGATIVTADHILVRVGDRACLAHRRWFDRGEAAELIQTLGVFVDQGDGVAS